MADWAAIENALVAWVKTATGYPDGQVIWSEQTPTGSRPVGEIITLRVGAIESVVDLDELDATTDLGQPAGQEVLLTAKGFKRFTLGMQAYGGTSTGNGSARAVLSRCLDALSLPTVRALLAAVNISVIDTGPVSNVTTVDHARFESRALAEVQFYMLDEVAERVGYIATVEPESYIGPPLGTTEEIDI